MQFRDQNIFDYKEHSPSVVHSVNCETKTSTILAGKSLTQNPRPRLALKRMTLETASSPTGNNLKRDQRSIDHLSYKFLTHSYSSAMNKKMGMTVNNCMGSNCGFQDEEFVSSFCVAIETLSGERRNRFFTLTSLCLYQLPLPSHLWMILGEKMWFWKSAWETAPDAGM